MESIKSLTIIEKNVNNEEELNKKINELRTDELPTANIIVAGITGTGKSTLLNAVFGENFAKEGQGKPVTTSIHMYGKKDSGIQVWDTVGLELNSQTTKKSIDDIKKVISEKSSEKDLFDRIHAIWYCINSGSSRYQGDEINFIKALYNVGVPFIIVLTQCIGDEDQINEFERIIKETNAKEGLEGIEVVQVLATDFKMRGFLIESFGLDVLVNFTLEKLPEFLKNGLIAAQKVSKSIKRVACEQIIYKNVKAAKEGFWDKVFVIKTYTINQRVVRMLTEISKLYNTDIKECTLEQAIKAQNLNFENIFFGLYAPVILDKGYSKKIEKLLNDRKEDGFEVDLGSFDKYNRTANFVAYFGYTFVDAVEYTWENLTEVEARNVEEVVSQLVARINENLENNKKKK
ncbi:MAG: GTPase [Lachnospirales bacterium]